MIVFELIWLEAWARAQARGMAELLLYWFRKSECHENQGQYQYCHENVQN